MSTAGAARTIAFVVFVAAQVPCQASLARPVDLVVLSTNDLHGALEPVFDQRAGVLGGLEYTASIIRETRRKMGGAVLVVDAGDCFRGDLPVDRQEGVPCVQFFNALDYDAVTLGNHEFDYQDCDASAHSRWKGPRCALKTALQSARYPVVVANLQANGYPPVWPALERYVLVRKAGVTVGMTGVVTPKTPMVTTPGATKGLQFLDPVKVLRRLVPEMRRKGARGVVVLAHLEGECPRGDSAAPCNVQGELGRLARELRGQVDLIVAGHSHRVISGSRHAVQVVEAGSHGRFVGYARVRVETDAKKPAATVQVLPPCPVAPPGFLPKPRPWRLWNTAHCPIVHSDRAISVLVRGLMHRYAKWCEKLVARVDTPIPKVEHSYESPVSDLAADLLRRLEPAADLAMENQGSSRMGIAAGPLTVCTLYRVWPFADRAVAVKLTGREVKRMVRYVVEKVGKFFAFSGLVITLQKGTGRVLKVELEGGEPLKDDA